MQWLTITKRGDEKKKQECVRCRNAPNTHNFWSVNLPIARLCERKSEPRKLGKRETLSAARGKWQQLPTHRETTQTMHKTGTPSGQQQRKTHANAHERRPNSDRREQEASREGLSNMLCRRHINAIDCSKSSWIQSRPCYKSLFLHFSFAPSLSLSLLLASVFGECV